MHRINSLLLGASLAFCFGLGCSQSDTDTYRSAITGEACAPNVETLVDEDVDDDDGKKPKCFGNNGHGNNDDGVDSSNPGQGNGGPNGEPDESCDGTGECIDDETRPGPADSEDCEIPVGCDADGCCEDPPGEDPPDSDIEFAPVE